MSTTSFPCEPCCGGTCLPAGGCSYYCGEYYYFTFIRTQQEAGITCSIYVGYRNFVWPVNTVICQYQMIDCSGTEQGPSTVCMCTGIRTACYKVSYPCCNGPFTFYTFGPENYEPAIGFAYCAYPEKSKRRIGQTLTWEHAYGN
jgi:hypothetical protein